MRIRPIATCLLVSLLATQTLASADEPPEEQTGVELPEQHVPLLENFPVPEQVAMYTLAVVDIVTVAFQKQIVDGLDPPLVGPPNGVDRAISDALDREGT